MFKDRIDAGLRLSEKLLHFKSENVVILAIPRGGLPLGAIVAKTLQAPLDVVLTKKIGHPNQKEYAIGAVSLENIVLSDALGISKKYIEEETALIRRKLRTRTDQYYKSRSPQDLKDKTVIIIDDGIATGNTILVTVELVSSQMPGKIVVAIPVAPNSTAIKLKESPFIDDVVCLETPYNFRAVGQFYEKFQQVSDDEAVRLLEESILN